jgi:hypothetical protein
MATFNKFYAFVEHLAEKIHNLGSDPLTFALTDVAPVVTNTVLANLTQISYTNLSSRVPTITVSAQSLGVYTLKFADHVLTASGGSVGPFRYVVLYNDAPVSPTDPLIGWYDYGAEITLLDGETLTIADQTNGILQIA